METTVKLYSLNYSNVKTYLAASLFIVGNILFPRLFHLIPLGGLTWLPIYFFTLIGAYKYGWKVGLLTAILSPVINSLLFGMPVPRQYCCHSIEIRIISNRRRMGCATLRTHFYPCISRSSLVLSDHRHIGRVDVYRKFLQNCSGFPHRYSRNVPASIRRLFVIKYLNTQVMSLIKK